MADRPTRLTQPEPEPESEPSLYPGQAPVSRYLFLSVLSAGMYISHLIDGSGRSWCTVYTGVLLWRRTEARQDLPSFCGLHDPGVRTGRRWNAPCIFFLPSPGGYVRTNEDPHGRQRKATDRRDACVYGVSNIWRLRTLPWRRKRPWTSCGGRRMLSMSAGAACVRWKLKLEC